MNKPIQKLAEEAGFNLIRENCYDMVSTMSVQEFAELIVRECIGVVEGGSFLHDQAPTAIFARECSGAIKRHFGVG